MKSISTVTRVLKKPQGEINTHLTIPFFGLQPRPSTGNLGLLLTPADHKAPLPWCFCKSRRHLSIQHVLVWRSFSPRPHILPNPKTFDVSSPSPPSDNIPWLSTPFRPPLPPRLNTPGVRHPTPRCSFHSPPPCLLSRFQISPPFASAATFVGSDSGIDC